tara:strand:+ start:225 stop:431 length:207 start_codon:yes stop_codon:yes gene_type:complete
VSLHHRAQQSFQQMHNQVPHRNNIGGGIPISSSNGGASGYREGFVVANDDHHGDIANVKSNMVYSLPE